MEILTHTTLHTNTWNESFPTHTDIYFFVFRAEPCVYPYFLATCVFSPKNNPPRQVLLKWHKIIKIIFMLKWSKKTKKLRRMLKKKLLDSKSPKNQYPPPKKKNAQFFFWGGGGDAGSSYFVILRGPVWAGQSKLEIWQSQGLVKRKN